MISIWTLIALTWAANVVLWTAGDRVILFVINARAGCWPWSPAEVEYYPGMTLCPGQTAKTTIMIPLSDPIIYVPEGRDI